MPSRPPRRAAHARARLAVVVVVAASTATFAACSTGGDDLSLAAGSSTTTVEPTAPADDDGPNPTEDPAAAGDGADRTTSTSPSSADDEENEPGGPDHPEDEPADISLEPRDHRVREVRPDQCLALAEGPWTRTDYGRDPLQAIRDGEIPGLYDGVGNIPFETVVDFPTLASYEDVSTLQDPAAVQEAWAEAGYVDGVMAEYAVDNYQFQVAAVRFRDAAGAGAALTAHLHDYCQRSVQARTVPKGNGVTVLRDKGAVRTLWIEGDVVLSAFACVCYAKDDPSRQGLVEFWAGQISGALTSPAPGSDTV